MQRLRQLKERRAEITHGRSQTGKARIVKLISYLWLLPSLSSCSAYVPANTCPDLFQRGNGNDQVEMARTCARFSGARFSASNDSSSTIGLAATVFCGDLIDTIVAGEKDFLQREQLRKIFAEDVRKWAVYAAVATRAGDCFHDKDFLADLARPISYKRFPEPTTK